MILINSSHQINLVLQKKFSQTDKFTNTEHFTHSEIFTKSYYFSKSSHFSSTKEYTSSNKFSNTNEFSNSADFSSTNEFNLSNVFSPSPTLVPNMPVCSVISNDQYLILNKRCDYNSTNANQTNIEIICSNFTYYAEIDDCGAIRIINCDFKCNSTYFYNCSSVS